MAPLVGSLGLLPSHLLTALFMELHKPLGHSFIELCDGVSWSWAFWVAQRLRICLPTQEMQAWSLGWEDPVEKEMAIHSSILAWEIPWMEEPGGLYSLGLQGVRLNLATKQQT